LRQRKILIACYEVPGWGGASTATYKLFEMLQADGMDVTLVNLIGEHDFAYFKYRFGKTLGNPRNLSRVINCRLTGNNYRYQPGLHELISEIDPDLMVGVGWIATHVLKTADPSHKLVYITTGCGWMGTYADHKRGNDLQSVSSYELRNPKLVTCQDALEKGAIDKADFVVAHSDINLHLYKTLYPGHAGKMYNKAVWFYEWIFQDAQQYSAMSQPFENREIDVLFVANDWTRPVKGFWQIEEMARGLNGLNVHIVGELPEPLPKFHQHGFVADRESLFELMGRSRVVASTSSYDAAPGILFEAAAMGCNIVASKNCGNWELCHPDLLVDPAKPGTFVQRIKLARTRQFPSNTSRFEDTRSYLDLKNLLAVI
jgi:glycosyltransferase involved in cell wall biosynthesis